MTTLTETSDIILRAAARLEKLADSAQAGDIQDHLQSAGLFGGSGEAGRDVPPGYTAAELAFDSNSKAAKLIFAIMDSMNPPYSGKMNATLTVTSKGDVTVNVTGDRAKELQPKMQGTFGKPMSSVLKAKKALPAGDMVVQWLSGVG